MNFSEEISQRRSSVAPARGGPLQARHLLVGFVVALPLTALSYRFLDAGVALFFHRLIMSNAVLRKYASDIPDLLLAIVLTITVLSWSAYLLRAPRHAHDRHEHFLQLCGTSMPLSFVVKMLLQNTFGRFEPKLWLDNHALAGFHWFQGGCLPSGHMTVFTTLAMVLWYFYPRHWRLYLTNLVLLGLALVATNYHFVSDVIAGAYLGLLVCYLTDLGLRALSTSYRAG